MGRIPDWYLLVRAAKYYGVGPWELLEHEPHWYYMALQADKAEIEGSKPATVRTIEGGE